MESVDVIFTGHVLPGLDAQRVAAELSRLTGLAEATAFSVLTGGQARLGMRGLTPEHGRAWLLRLSEIGVEAQLRESTAGTEQSFGPPAAVQAAPVVPIVMDSSVGVSSSSGSSSSSEAKLSRRQGLFWACGGAACALLFVVLFFVFRSPAPSPSLSATQTNSIGMEFVLISAGSFEMGCSASEPEDDCFGDEKPRHTVTISRPFYLGKYEVTQAQWQAVMGNNPSRFKGPNRPVENVSWDDIQEFIKKLNAKEGHNFYRLPTEAEWEYAARAGSQTAYSFGNDKGQLGNYAWYEDNAGGETHPVGQKQANAWGLHDMHGNVWEWVADWSGSYSAGSVVDPQGPQAGGVRVLRGGSWRDDAGDCRSASRIVLRPALRDSSVGFRLVRSSGH